ncbi:podoplanin isoform X1 [Takifugu rubripes]|uniref:podoplanin isoform X1 n=1 Tax=Takifugu rubripes TaxID=31033 RepID=UPI001145A8CD|nr:fibrous sheath CABYR-binding protein-like isoform X1 [Takifugu rubripes]
MNAQLLLLLALAGPFCAFTRASPTLILTNTDSSVIQPATFYNSAPPKSNFVITGPPPTVPDVLVLEITAAPATAEVPPEITAAPATAEVPPEITAAPATAEVPPEITAAPATAEVPPEITAAPATAEDPPEITAAPATAEVPPEITAAPATSEVPQKVTMEATPEVDLNDTMVTSKQTEVPGQLLSTHAATAETAAPTKEAEVVQTSGTAAATTESIGFQKQTEGLTSGQAAGIVIGVLLAVAFVIAVAIFVARRMGKYSP